MLSTQDSRLLGQKDKFDMTPRDRAILTNNKSTSRRIKHAESEYDLLCSPQVRSKLLNLKVWTLFFIITKLTNQIVKICRVIYFKSRLPLGGDIQAADKSLQAE